MQMIHDAIRPEMLEKMKEMFKNEATQPVENIEEAARLKAIELSDKLAKRSDEIEEQRERDRFMRAIERAR